MAEVLVTGGAGFIGSHLVEALVARGDRVRVLDDLSSGRRDNLAAVAERITFFEGSVADPAAAAAATAGVEFVFHQAALASVPRSLERPLDTHLACATGTLVLLDAARRAGVRRVVYAASSSAYGDQPFASKREQDQPAPLSPYAAAKLAGELYAEAFRHSFGLETVSLRYFNIFGPRQDPDSPYAAVIPLFLQRLLRGERPQVYGDGQQSRDFTYVANVVQANLKAAAAPAATAAGRTFNVGTGRSFSLLEVLAALGRLLGVNPNPEHLPPRVGDVRDSLADITRARAVLGYEPAVDFEAGLALTVEQFRRGAEREVRARGPA